MVMKICLTGASGSLGSALHQALREAGHDVIATDLCKCRDATLPVTVANLLDREAPYALLEGADTLIHVGNHPNSRRIDSQRTYLENVTMNMHVFQAALECGVQRILFASSVQTVAYCWADQPPYRVQVPCLPVPHEWPGQPSNTYGLSKIAGEQMLDFYAQAHGLPAVSLRLPGMNGYPKRKSIDKIREELRGRAVQEFLSHFTFQEAARLFLALAERHPWEGHRRFFCAFREPWATEPIPELLHKYYPDVPLLKPAEEMDCLWEADQLEAFCGWKAPSVGPRRALT